MKIEMPSSSSIFIFRFRSVRTAFRTKGTACRMVRAVRTGAGMNSRRTSLKSTIPQSLSSYRRPRARLEWAADPAGAAA